MHLKKIFFKTICTKMIQVRSNYGATMGSPCFFFLLHRNIYGEQSFIFFSNQLPIKTETCVEASSGRVDASLIKV